MIRHPHYTPDFQLDSGDIRIRFKQKDDVSFVRAEMVGDRIVFYYQSTEVFKDDDIQIWIWKTLKEFGRKRVKEKLVPRLLKMAKERGLKVNNVRASSAKGRWGSCSSKCNINLSLYLAFLPTHLQNYVIQHELTHLIEMNHSPRFWARLDEVLEGKAKALRREIRGLNFSFV